MLLSFDFVADLLIFQRSAVDPEKVKLAYQNDVLYGLRIDLSGFGVGNIISRVKINVSGLNPSFRSLELC